MRNLLLLPLVVAVVVVAVVVAVVLLVLCSHRCRLRALQGMPHTILS